jgi:hypothetical protein
MKLTPKERAIMTKATKATPKAKITKVKAKAMIKAMPKMEKAKPHRASRESPKAQKKECAGYAQDVAVAIPHVLMNEGIATVPQNPKPQAKARILLAKVTPKGQAKRKTKMAKSLMKKATPTSTSQMDMGAGYTQECGMHVIKHPVDLNLTVT